MSLARLLLGAGLVLMLCSCFVGTDLAPVSEAWYQQPKTDGHVVRAQETLYAVAWRYGLDYRDLAKRNHLKTPYALRVGQVLQLPVGQASNYTKTAAPKKIVNSTPKVRKQPQSRAPKAQVVHMPSHVKRWRWPLYQPRVLKKYSAKHHRGLELSVAPGSKVVAAARGQVVYSGRGLRGFGDLILIKHTDDVLSAYAHNKKTLVHEGQWVKAGQTIAELGYRPLHFQIRRKGKPVNPSQFLPKLSQS